MVAGGVGRSALPGSGEHPAQRPVEDLDLLVGEVVPEVLGYTPGVDRPGAPQRLETFPGQDGVKPPAIVRVRLPA